MGQVRLSGGDIRYGLGWIVLLPIAAASLPDVANHLDTKLNKKPNSSA